MAAFSEASMLQNECLDRLRAFEGNIAISTDHQKQEGLLLQAQALLQGHRSWLEKLKEDIASLERLASVDKSQDSGSPADGSRSAHGESSPALASEGEQSKPTSEPTISKARGGLSTSPASYETQYPLESSEYQRYGRQLIMPEIGPKGQSKLKNSRVLVVGAGGLGCPASAYLAGAGVGTLGIVDGDTVEASNLHRQILHDSGLVGINKAESVAIALQRINPLTTVKCFTEAFTPLNAEAVAKDFDVILDCTDNPASRYLISDIAVLLGKPLVSASALKTEGQLMVLNDPPMPPGSEGGGPCYRCIFPKPPPLDSVLTCGEGGILGPVVGTMGLLQALEAIKVIVEDRLNVERESRKPSMLMFSAMSDTQFRTVRLRGRRKGCVACAMGSGLSLASLREGRQDYIAFCGAAQQERVDSSEQVSVREVSGAASTIIDVRDETQFDICHLPGSLNIPFSDVQRWKDKADILAGLSSNALTGDVFVVCRLGNDSQVSVRKMKSLGLGDNIKDVKGGFKAWREQIDPGWPCY